MFRVVKINVDGDIDLDFFFAVNVVDGEKHSPLHFCCKTGHLAIMTFLLQQGANPNCTNIYGDTPLHLYVMSLLLSLW